ncbi:lysophosphatidylcholine acyltransferase 2-like isoform X2 [Montipora capricornis]|uniref:lysophosphatidylcholine acyltransferase 2-like isoform X2 n=1 Tax=Montipora capricornis TaxID=246305 RepID=UPI0035F11B57
MLPVVVDEVKRFYSELNLKEPVVRNPFKSCVRIPWRKKFEIIFGLMFLLPIRLALGFFLFLCAVILCNIITVGWNPRDQLRTPLSPWRRKVRDFLPVIIRSLLFALGFHTIKIKGKLAPLSEAFITVIAPHSSFLDILLLCEYGYAPSGLSKTENLTNPIFGAFFQSLEVITVSRDNTKSRQNAVKELMYRASTTRGQWPHMCIFPEGTCTNGKCLISFKSGAFIPGCSVQPVLLRFPNDLDIYSWTWDGPGSLLLTILLLCQPSNVAEIEFLPVWNPTKEEKENPKVYAEHVRQYMARCLNVPVTGHSFEDALLMTKAAALGLPPDTGVIEFCNTAGKLGISVESAKEQLERFAAMDSDQDGQISVEDFALFYNLPISKPVKEIFKIMDRHNKGFIDFRQYIVGTACLARIAAKKEVAESALKEYSKPKKRVVVDSNFKDILESILQTIDNTDYGNHNVRSRNEEFREFLSRHHELTTLLSSLPPRETHVGYHVRESRLI